MTVRRPPPRRRPPTRRVAPAPQPALSMKPEDGWTSSDDELDDVTRELLETVKSWSDLILPPAMSGKLVAVIHGHAVRSMVEALEYLGWDGRSRVFVINPWGCAKMAGVLDKMGDPSSRDFWLSSAAGRIVVVNGPSIVMVHYDPKRGYSAGPAGTALN